MLDRAKLFSPDEYGQRILSVGKVVIGRQVVDLTTAQTAAGGPSVKAGDVIVVVGTQPSLSGTISAQLVMQSD